MVVRMRNTSSHAKNRRSHHALKGERLSKDKTSGAVHPRHKALLDGTPYRGRSVMDTTVKKAGDKKAPAKDAAKDVESGDAKVQVKEEAISKEAATSKKPTEKKVVK